MNSIKSLPHSNSVIPAKAGTQGCKCSGGGPGPPLSRGRHILSKLAATFRVGLLERLPMREILRMAEAGSRGGHQGGAPFRSLVVRFAARHIRFAAGLVVAGFLLGIAYRYFFDP